MTTRQHTVLLSVANVAERLGCSRSHVYTLIADGKLPTINIGRGRSITRIPESRVEKYINDGLTVRKPITEAAS